MELLELLTKGDASLLDPASSQERIHRLAIGAAYLVEALRADNLQDAINTIHAAEDIYPYDDTQEMDALSSAVLNEAIRIHYRCESKKEYYYQELFKKQVENIIPGAKLASRQMMQEHRPDAWIELDGAIIPVEVKLYNFNKTALRQLQRYIDVYGESRGVAVARQLTVDLPDNIIFIGFDKLNDPLGDVVEKFVNPYRKLTEDELVRSFYNIQYYRYFQEGVLPLGAASKLNDCINDWNVCDPWRAFHDMLMNCTVPVGGGERRYNPDSSIDKCLYNSGDESDYEETRLRLKYYPIYFCDDGHLRYKRDDIIERRIEEEYEKFLDEYQRTVVRR